MVHRIRIKDEQINGCSHSVSCPASGQDVRGSVFIYCFFIGA